MAVPKGPPDDPPSTNAAAKLSRTAKRNAMKRAAARRRSAENAGIPHKDKPKAKKQKRAEGAPADGADVALRVLFEDEHLIAVNKPPGLLCHPSPGYWDSGTVVHSLPDRERSAGFSPIPEVMLAARLGPTGESDSFIPRAIVHRLDKGTSGVLLVAKSPLAEAHLGAAFRGRSTSKTYVAILAGRPHLPHDAGLRGTRGAASAISERDHSKGGGIAIQAPIGKDEEATNGRMAVVDDVRRGKHASSVVHLHAYSPTHGLTLATVDLHTGRQHQIRVHAAFLGAPVANDDLYDPHGAPSFRASYSSLACGGSLGRGRPLLHAWRMHVAHPVESTPHLDVAAPLPRDLASIVSHMWPALPRDPRDWPELTIAQLDELHGAGAESRNDRRPGRRAD